MVEEQKNFLPKAVYAKRIGITLQALKKYIAHGEVDLHGSKQLVWVEDADRKIKDAAHPSHDYRRKVRIPSDDSLSPKISVSASQDVGEIDTSTIYESRTIKAREDARRAKIAREKEDIELAILKGSMVSVEDVSRDVAQIYAQVRTRLLALPVELAARIAANKSVLQIKIALDEGIRGALDKLSDTIADGHSSTNSAIAGKQLVASASKVERGKVGRPKRISVT